MPQLQKVTHIARVFFTLLFFVPALLFSQDEQSYFYDEYDELIPDNLKSVTQCNQGFIWLLHKNKITRFDGKEFWTYPACPDTLAGNDKGYFSGLGTYQDSLLFMFTDYYLFTLNPLSNQWQSFQLKKDSVEYRLENLQQLSGNDLLLQCSKRMKDNSTEVEYWRFQNQRFSFVELPEKIKGNHSWLTIDNSKNKYLINDNTLQIWDSTDQLISKISLDDFLKHEDYLRTIKMQFSQKNQLNILIDGKLYLLNDLKNSLSLHPIHNAFHTDSFSDNFQIHQFFHDKNDNIWILGRDDSSQRSKKVFYYNNLTKKIYDFNDWVLTGNFNGIIQDKAGVVWMATESGLGKFHNQVSFFKEFDIGEPEDYLSNDYDYDTIWDGSLYTITTSATWVGYAPIYPALSDFTENEQGEIFTVFENKVIQFDPSDKNISKKVFPVDRCVDIHFTERGILLGSGRLLNPATGDLVDITNAHPKISPEEEWERFTMRSRWDKNYYMEILQGKTRYALELQYKKYYSDLILEDKNQTIWRANDSTLYYLDQSKVDWIWREVMDTLIVPMAEEKLLLDSFNIKFEELIRAFSFGKSSNKLWLGFHSGKLLSYSPSTKQLKRYELKEKDKYLTIYAIHEDSEEMLWLATSDGLYYFNPKTNEKIKYGKEEGLYGIPVLGLLTEGDSCLWMSAAEGISRFHIPSLTVSNFPLYYDSERITHNFEPQSYFKSSNDQMFFGQDNAVISFIPKNTFEEHQDVSRNAPFVLSSFEYADEIRDTIIKKYNLTNHAEIHLEYGSKSLNFEFALTDFHTPRELFYSYSLEGSGYDDTWSIPSKLNVARFVSLPSGNYTFKVKAQDSRRLWYPNQLELQLIVHPPWWKTNLAYFIYFLILSAIAYAIFSFVKRRLELQAQLKLEQQEALRLKELDSFKNKLYTNLTHEFRTPLTVILGMVQQIRNEPKKYLDEGTRMVETNGRNLLQLINQLLDLSKLENHSFQLKLQQSDIIPFVKYITESFHTYVNSKNLSLQFFTPEESLVMDYDPEQIKQVLTNLISNAVKFTPSGGEVIVRVTKETEQLKIEVKDTGIGIAEKDLTHIFDRFYQVDGSMTREGEGTGIGLAHTKELVKLMDGKISVNSMLEKGSTFTILLPIRNEATVIHSFDKKGISNINLDLKKSDNLALANNPTEDLPQLLIIEDNHDVVVYLKSCLENSYQIDVAYNGQVGIEKATKNIPDLIISDVMMPQKDGFEVCDFLKNDERTSHIPIILLTAKADADSKIIGLKRGADAYLSKPFDKEELIIRLEKLVERQQKMRAYFSAQTIGNIQSVKTEGIEEVIQIEDAFIQKVKKIIEEHYSDENFALPQLCQKIRMSRSQLFRKMKALVNTSPSDFIRTYRLEKAKYLLETTEMNVSEVSWEVGFKDVSHFSKAFQNKFGYLPSATHN